MVHPDPLPVCSPAAPELLPYAADIVKDVKKEVEERQEILNSSGESSGILDNIRQMELDRIQYVLHDYLRIRLRKVGSLFSLLACTSSLELVSVLTSSDFLTVCRSKPM